MEILDSSDELSQLFEKVLYAIKNKKRRLILGAFNEDRILSNKDIQQYLIGKGLVKNKSEYGLKKIRDYYLKPLIETEVIKEERDDLFEITLLGRDVREAIRKFKELEDLPPPTYRGLNRELIFLELRGRKMTYEELKSKLNFHRLRNIIKRLKDLGFLKLSHPYNLLPITSLSHFTISPYYYFIKGIKAFLEKTGRSWFTEYSIIHHLTLCWKEKFGKPLDLKETLRLIKEGLEVGDIVKTNGGYELSDKLSFETISPSEIKILNLIKEIKKFNVRMASEKGFQGLSIYKFLERLVEKKLLEKQKEYVEIELTEKGRKLADALFKIKEILKKEELRLK